MNKIFPVNKLDPLNHLIAKHESSFQAKFSSMRDEYIL